MIVINYVNFCYYLCFQQDACELTTLVFHFMISCLCCFRYYNFLNHFFYLLKLKDFFFNLKLMFEIINQLPYYQYLGLYFNSLYSSQTEVNSEVYQFIYHYFYFILLFSIILIRNQIFFIFNFDQIFFQFIFSFDLSFYYFISSSFISFS